MNGDSSRAGRCLGRYVSIASDHGAAERCVLWSKRVQGHGHGRGGLSGADHNRLPQKAGGEGDHAWCEPDVHAPRHI